MQRKTFLITILLAVGALCALLVACSQGSADDKSAMDATQGAAADATSEAAVESEFNPYDIMALAEMTPDEFAAIGGEERSDTVRYFDIEGYEVMEGMTIDENGMMVYDTLYDEDSDDPRVEVAYCFYGMNREDLDRVAEYYMEQAGLSDPRVEYRYTSETGPFLQYVGWCEIDGEPAIWQLNTKWCWSNEPRGEIHCMVKRCSDGYINHNFEGPFTYDELIEFYDSRPAFVILDE